ncbi:MAG: thiamine phosphate synthase [Epsilonproteobacteria bacterium]|nr:thiamine phosphate synthase [Campylobacterota bacterium]
MRKEIPLGLYGITAENFANGKSNIECVKEMIKAGIKIIQYREKQKSLKQKAKEAKEIAKICKDNDVVFIVNDHVDIALLVEADGVHIGQDDMDIQDVRKIIPQDMIVGLSTHCKEDAINAVKNGADYIGVGPIFKTTTKDREPVGLEYLEFVVKNIDIPFVAIGGIKEHNIDDIVKTGAKRVSLVSEIVGAKDIGKKIERLLNKMQECNYMESL